MPAAGTGMKARDDSTSQEHEPGARASMHSVGALECAVSTRRGMTRKQRRMRCLVRMQVFAIHPFGYEMAVLMPYHDFCAASGKAVPFRKGNCAANRLVLIRIGLGITSSAPDDLPPGFFADDHVS